MDAASQPRAWKVLLTFAIIYFVWGSTFLAIRGGVREVPPFLLAGMRFLVAGLVLYGWMRTRGTASPTAREWGAASFLAVLIFVFDYGLLFWAERRVPSGIAAGHDGDHPGVHGPGGNCFPSHPTPHIATWCCPSGGDGRRRRSRRTLDEPGRGSSGYRRRLRLDRSGHQLVGGSVSQSQAAAACRQSHELWSADARGRRAADADRSAAGRIPRLPRAGGLARGMARVGVLDRGGIDHRLHGVCLAHSPRIANQGGNVRVRESGSRGAGGIFSGRRSDWSAHHRGNPAGAGECGGDHDHAEKEAGVQTFHKRNRLNKSRAHIRDWPGLVEF